MRYSRMIITAADEYWLDAALREFCGYSASMIACDAEIGVESFLTAEESPDGRPAAKILIFGGSAEAIASRTGQCLMTCPSTAVFNGLPEGDRQLALGKHVRFFGDGFQKSKVIAGRRLWRIPVMDGEFLIEDTLGSAKGIAGGNIIIQGIDYKCALAAARRASEALQNVPEIITPFPGGVARSGSKVGSRYKGLVASTSDPYCPTLKGRTETKAAS